MMAFIFIAMLLSACDEDNERQYGFQFDVFCPNATHPAGWVTDKNGRIVSMMVGFWTTVFVRHGGGYFKDGAFTPLPFDQECQVRASAVVWNRVGPITE